MGWKRFPPHIYCAIAVFFWGFVATIQAAITNWSGLMTCRFFLGVAEAMFGPGVPLYLSFFYPRNKVAFRHGVYVHRNHLSRHC
jgi:MFS family permease